MARAKRLDRNGDEDEDRKDEVVDEEEEEEEEERDSADTFAGSRKSELLAVRSVRCVEIDRDVRVDDVRDGAGVPLSNEFTDAREGCRPNELLVPSIRLQMHAS